MISRRISRLSFGYSCLVALRVVSAFLSAQQPVRLHSRSSIDATGNKFEYDVPLVFIHGMKGSHLSLETKIQDRTPSSKKKRVWLRPSALLNFPPRADDHYDRDLSLPLTYSSDCGTIQDRGDLSVDGLVDHILEFGSTRMNKRVELLPFYGHVSKHLQQLEEDGIRPTRSFVYDWRRSLPEISEDFHKFCETEFPGKPVQVLAHSMGGLVTFDQMRQHPEKYAAGAVLVGVPFGTGIQYFQDLHRGYYTELGRNRQFTPPSQFSLSSHWSFFPMSDEEAGDTFVDVTDCTGEDINDNFRADESAIGNPGTTFQPTVSGKKISFDFYDVDHWEENEVGIFDPAYRRAIDRKTLDSYKEHMRVQLKLAKDWRLRAMCPGPSKMPNLVVCQTNTYPTLNQILRRKRAALLEDACSQWEYDYVSGRSVPGDGRIDYDKSFPPVGFKCKKVALDSLHAKQMCWEASGGNFGKIMGEVTIQLQKHCLSEESPSELSVVASGEDASLLTAR